MDEAEGCDLGMKERNVLMKAMSEIVVVDFFYPWDDDGTATGRAGLRDMEQVAALKAAGASPEEIREQIGLQQLRKRGAYDLISDYRGGGKCLVDRRVLERLLCYAATACLKAGGKGGPMDRRPA